MIGLADCNNFFVSCERTINKDLEGRAVVVMSNNDGCAIARSNEAKALGIKMGQPMFEIRHLVNSGQLVAISSNYALYHEISNVVHKIFHKYAPTVIDYSVDEAFFDLTGIPVEALDEIGANICNECLSEAGIPVTVGFSHTKTLAKIASEIGKKSKRRVVTLVDPVEINDILSRTPINDVWGIGRRTARKLYFEGIHTAKNYIDCDIHHIKHLTGINGVKTHNELRMIPCIDLDACNRPIQNSISESRTFSRDISDYEIIKTRLTTYTTHCATRLRHMNSQCSSVIVYLATNRFHTNESQQFPSIEIRLNRPSGSTSLLVEAMIQGLDKIFDPAIAYKKAGIVLANISSIRATTPSLFDPIEDNTDDSNHQLMQAIDEINHSSSGGVLRLASQMGLGKIGESSALSSSFQFRSKK